MTNGNVPAISLVLGLYASACGGTDDAPPGDTAGGTTSGGMAGGGAATGGTATGGGGTDGAATGGAGTGGTGPGGAGTGGATGGAFAGGAGEGGAQAGGAATGGAGVGATGGAAGNGAAGDAGTGGAATGGAGTGGGASCFPAITDFGADDGGFGSAEREVVQIGTGDSVSLFRPSDESFGRDGCQHPLLVWGNGSTNTVDIWAGHLSRAASFGFVIVAPEQTQVNSGHMNDALDYVLELSQDPSSDYGGKIDPSKLGATGYSLGGAGAMQVASNERIGATFIWDSFGNCSSLHGPFGTIVASDGLGGLDLIDGCPPPAFGMEAAGTNHTSILGYPGGFGGPGGQTPYAQESYVAWFRWHFMGDPAAEALFVGESCGFCTREGMTVRKNGID
jgi:hypothetical protein